MTAKAENGIFAEMAICELPSLTSSSVRFSLKQSRARGDRKGCFGSGTSGRSRLTRRGDIQLEETGCRFMHRCSA